MYASILGFAGSLIACACFYMLKEKKIQPQNAIWLVYLGLFAFSTFLLISGIVYRVQTPEIWDFTAFYMYGKVGASGHNFYSPEDFHQVFNSMQLPFADTNEFSKEVVDVGFPYPPPTILYFVPLGFMSFKTALAFWTILNALFLFGSMFLAYRLFFRAYKINGLMLVVILFGLLPAVRSTIWYTQTNFILLFYLLLIRKFEGKPIAGIFLSLAIFTKPYLIIIGLFFVLRKKWLAIVYAAAAAALLCGVIFAVYGKSPFVNYIIDNPSKRMPAFVFSEGINQSLNATLLRAGIISLGNSTVYVYVAAGVLALMGAFLFVLIKRRIYEYVVPILLLVGLFLYPGTLSYYGVLLLFVVFQFFDEKKELGFPWKFTVPIVAVFYLLSGLSLFAAICFLLIILMLKSLTVRSVTRRQELGL